MGEATHAGIGSTRTRLAEQTIASFTSGCWWESPLRVLLLLLYYRRITSIRGPATYAGGASPAALTHSGVLFPYRQEHSQLSSKVASVVAIEPKGGFSNFTVHLLLGGPRQSSAAGVFGGSFLHEGVGEGKPAGRRYLPPGEV